MVTLVAQKAVDLGVLAEFDIFFGAPLTLSGQTSQHLTVTQGAISMTLSGEAFTYDGSGEPTGGALHAIDVRTFGTQAYSFAGLSIDLLAFATAPDSAAIRQMLYDGLSGDDRLTGSPFADLLGGFAGKDRISGGDGDDYLEGDSGKDKLKGGAGNDVLSGGPGKDLLNGGGGDDTATFSDKSGTLVLTLNGSHRVQVTIAGVGEDTIKNVENIFGSRGKNKITGDSHDNSFFGDNHRDIFDGAGGDDSLTGKGGSDKLAGGAGMDRISGGLGKDVLTGGRGHDTFLFYDAPAVRDVDRITDFHSGVDQFEINHWSFLSLPAGTLAAASLRIGAHAVDADDFVIYNPANGKLFYDHDGAGGDAPIQFARLAPDLALSHSDFVVTA